MTYSVPGMSCGHCKAAVEHELGRVAGVEAVDVDLETKLVVVAGHGPLRCRAARGDRRGRLRGRRERRDAQPGARRSRRSRDDVRVVRRADRAEAEQARRRRGDRQLRHRAGHGHVRPRARARRASSSPPSRRSATARRCRGARAREARRVAERGFGAGSSAPRSDRAARRCSRWCRRSSSTAGSGSRFALATPVVFWAGWPFHRAALAQRCATGAATMDTLISLGTLAAWAWSAVVLLAGARRGHATSRSAPWSRR